MKIFTAVYPHTNNDDDLRSNPMLFSGAR